MASSSSSARSAHYAPPTLLEDLHILDYLELLDEQPALNEQLWLLLPQTALSSKAARLCLRHQVAKLKTMQDSHGIQT